uniref:Uncharacterized protein n=1 Tax=Arundo donax TaxID=35708 RepID=A0A0A9ASC6_ARUDO
MMQLKLGGDGYILRCYLVLSAPSKVWNTNYSTFVQGQKKLVPIHSD